MGFRKLGGAIGIESIFVCHSFARFRPSSRACVWQHGGSLKNASVCGVLPATSGARDLRPM
jgi:hypothetical protein